MILVRSIISDSKLIDGGAAMFAAEKRNHHIVIVGKIICIPFVRNNLRVLVDSYVMFASAKSPDEHRPWATLMPRAPCHPQVELDRRPASKSPM